MVQIWTIFYIHGLQKRKRSLRYKEIKNEVRVKFQFVYLSQFPEAAEQEILNGIERRSMVFLNTSDFFKFCLKPC